VWLSEAAGMAEGRGEGALQGWADLYYAVVASKLLASTGVFLSHSII
jgi:hypothetical protein